ncbi:MAG: tRNA (cytidine(34)-2'-O)-methyltransferase [Oscillospiraceae bacterium]|nr:tRNA (cytidine(34)-2'-O)-methyltransferase [Oscillospiraceae bacterium]
MINIVLVEPEIPANTGNISRTCAVTGCRLHLIKPLGFDISDSAVKRAGLDYWHLLDLTVYENLGDFFQKNPDASDIWLATSKAPRSYCEASFSDGCWIFFGKETAGLPRDFREAHREQCLRIPMLHGVRCLNLSNSVAVFAYEALRQQGFSGFQEAGEMAEGTAGI